MGILGGQAVQAARLVRAWDGDPDVEAWLVPINPVPPGAVRVGWRRQVPAHACDPADLLAAARFASSASADVVHVFSASYFSFLLAPLPAVLVARLLGKPVRHELPQRRGPRSPAPIARSRETRSRAVDRNAVPSTFLHDVFARFGIDSEVIPNIVDVERFAFRRREPLRPRLLSTRNFESLYNVACTLRAFRLVQDRYPDATLTLVGAGSQDASLRALARCSGLQQRHVRGPRAAGRHLALLRRCGHLPSDADIDNMPASVLEAFASGCAVVCDQCGRRAGDSDRRSTRAARRLRRSRSRGCRDVLDCSKILRSSIA